MIFYTDSSVFNAAGTTPQNIEEAKEYLTKLDQFDYKFKIDEYYLNQYHFRGLCNGYIDLAQKGQAKIGFKELLTKIAAKEFTDYGARITEYYDLMVNQVFLPNCNHDECWWTSWTIVCMFCIRNA